MNKETLEARLQREAREKCVKGRSEILYAERTVVTELKLSSNQLDQIISHTIAETIKAAAEEQLEDKKYTQIDHLKDAGLHGSTKDPDWNPVTKRHDCCGSPRSYYHRRNCPLCKDI